jgi:hypothetical protein
VIEKHSKTGSAANPETKTQPVSELSPTRRTVLVSTLLRLAAPALDQRGGRLDQRSRQI